MHDITFYYQMCKVIRFFFFFGNIIERTAVSCSVGMSPAVSCAHANASLSRLEKKMYLTNVLMSLMIIRGRRDIAWHRGICCSWVESDEITVSHAGS
jgi:hypothetical protein